MKVKQVVEVSDQDVSFHDVRDWFTDHMHPDVIDFDDQKVYEYVYHAGRWGGIFQLTSGGAQQLFIKAKPRSLVDIATLTSIYRPGPLAAEVDKLYLKHASGEPYQWGHPSINKTLEKTKGLIIFQESVMQLAHDVAGFPLLECDEVRRAIMKRSISGGAAAQEKARELRDSFVKGAVGRGVPHDVADDLYDKILYFAGYGFNASCSIDSKVNIYRKGVFMQLCAKDVRSDDFIMSHDEATHRDVLVKVLKCHDHGTLPLVKVTLTSGETVTCTMDHKFRTVETGEMLPLWAIQERGLSIVVRSSSTTATAAIGASRSRATSSRGRRRSRATVTRSTSRIATLAARKVLTTLSARCVSLSAPRSPRT
jgi:DNA polymerase III subunit alpha